MLSALCLGTYRYLATYMGRYVPVGTRCPLGEVSKTSQENNITTPDITSGQCHLLLKFPDH